MLLIKLFFNFLRELRELGLKFTLISRLNYYTGIQAYSTIKYPIIGIKAEVKYNDYWKELWRGRWELNCVRYMSKIIREGQTILDVGAWIGMYTLLFSKLVKNKGRVYAFDPDPEAFDILRDNIEKNCLSNVYIEKICMSNSVGWAKLYPAVRFGSSGSSLIPYMCKPQGLKEIAAKTTTIDKYCEENGIHPDGIKIDVEGAEGLVIEGCQNIIENCSPWILLEFHGSVMSEKQRRTSWHKIADSAKEVIFLDGDSNQYHYGSHVKSFPDCLYFHVFIKY